MSELAKRIAAKDYWSDGGNDNDVEKFCTVQFEADAVRLAEKYQELETSLAASQAECERWEEAARHFRDGHAEIARGVKAGLGIEHWPDFKGKFQDAVAGLVRQVVADNAALRQQVEGLRKCVKDWVDYFDDLESQNPGDPLNEARELYHGKRIRMCREALALSAQPAAEPNGDAETLLRREVEILRRYIRKPDVETADRVLGLERGTLKQVCSKCGVDVRNRKAKYCGDGSDKDNEHRWEVVPVEPTVA